MSRSNNAVQYSRRLQFEHEHVSASQKDRWKLVLIFGVAQIQRAKWTEPKVKHWPPQNPSVWMNHSINIQCEYAEGEKAELSTLLYAPHLTALLFFVPWNYNYCSPISCHYHIYCCKSTSCTVNVITSAHRISCKCIVLMGAHFLIIIRIMEQTE